MSKSLGNSLLVDVMVTKVRPAELRYYLGQAHYRSELDYSPEALAEASAAYRRIENFVIRAAETSGSGGQDGTGLDPGALTATALPAAFTAAMDDDLSVPKALAVVHEAVTEGNSALASGDRAGAAKQAANVRAMMAVLGLDPLDEHWAGGGSGLSSVIEALVTVALGQRQAARERKDWAAADAIRDQLLAAGIVVEDTQGASRWELRR
jgi:cysteinyl-tRNA synthetase